MKAKKDFGGYVYKGHIFFKKPNQKQLEKIESKENAYFAKRDKLKSMYEKLKSLTDEKEKSEYHAEIRKWRRANDF